MIGKFTQASLFGRFALLFCRFLQNKDVETYKITNLQDNSTHGTYISTYRMSTFRTESLPRAMPPKRAPFQPAHALDYTLEVTSQDGKGSATACCLFCVHEGRDDVEVGRNGRKQAAADCPDQTLHGALLPAQVSKPP